MSSTNATFLKSPAQEFVRSACQARRRTPGTASTFKIAAAIVPLWGFGKFDPSSSLPGIAHYPRYYYYGNTHSTYLVFQNTWPRVYNKLVETWVQGPDTMVRTSEMSRFFDLIMTATYTTTSGSRDYAYSPTIISRTVTDTTVSISYTDGSESGVYTAQLSGTILQPSATGPFDPNDSTHGWANLTSQALTILSSISIPTTANTFNVQYLGSTGPVSSVYTYTVGPIIAAANGMAVSIGIFNHGGAEMDPSVDTRWLTPFNTNYFPIPTIGDYPSGSLPAAYIELNCGGCLVLKSEWALNGGDKETIYIYPATRGGDHAIVYGEGLIIDPATGIMSTAPPVQTASATVPYSNPVATPGTYVFGPGDVSLSGYTNGILGFQSTDL